MPKYHFPSEVSVTSEHRDGKVEQSFDGSRRGTKARSPTRWSLPVVALISSIVGLVTIHIQAANKMMNAEVLSFNDAS